MDTGGIEGFELPLGLLAFRRFEYSLLRGGIKGGGSLMRVISPGLPLGEAGSRHEVDGRLKRVTLAKQQRHSPPLRGPSLKGGLFFRLPLGAA